MYDEALVCLVEIFIENNSSRFSERINRYVDHMQRKVIKGRYTKEKALIGYRRYAADGIRLFLFKSPNNIFDSADIEEIAERLEGYYFKIIIDRLESKIDISVETQVG